MIMTKKIDYIKLIYLQHSHHIKLTKKNIQTQLEILKIKLKSIF